ncbi:MAG: DUF5916 domain-containing protein [Acidobacteriota bacterium]|jgi:hypothetical protein
MWFLQPWMLAAVVVQPQPATTPVTPAHRVTEEIRLDGVLDEPAWASVPTIGRLLQQEPTPESEPTMETEVRVLFDRDHLYFGILCRDSDPSAIVANQLSRDSRLRSDDHIAIIVDPFLDRRNGFFFETNPVGARSDGQVTNNAERRTLEWDGIWDAAARITEEGWVAEIEIPFKTLRFKPGQTTWGLNVERTVVRLNEANRWASPRREVWLTNLAMAGRLTGLEGIRQGRGLDIRPYTSTGRTDGDGQFEIGIDVFKSITSGLNASVTVNTDFAETEADNRRVNLTRFPLFFPEKRAFFLEGAGIFEVAGLPANRRSDLIPFFGRRIGLLEGEEVPIIAGAKLVGREKGFNIGVLDVVTDDVEITDYGAVDRQNLLVARVSRNLLTQSWVGGILTHGNPEGTGSNTLFGVDARFATSKFRGDKNLSLDLFFLGTKDETLDATDTSYGFRLDYPNELWDVGVSGTHVGANFHPALGFVRRTGVNTLGGMVQFRPRARGIGIRRFNFQFLPQLIYDLDGRLLDYRIRTSPLNLTTESQERVEFNVVPEQQTLDEPFEIQDGIVIPEGRYRWTRYATEIRTADYRPWELSVDYQWGGFYTGSRREIGLSLVLKPSPHFHLEFRGERNDVELEQGTFETQVYELGANINFSPNLFWANLVQFDNESDVLGLQSRFRWILKPGNDLFVVIDRGWERLGDRFRPASDNFTVKFQYTFRL